MALILATLAGLLAAAMSRLLSDELKAWAPWIIEHLICFAVRRLPARYRKRLSEEWRSHIAGVPGDIGKFIVACGFIRASRTIRYSHVAPSQRALGLLVLAVLAPLIALVSFCLFLEHRRSPITKWKVTADGRRVPGFRFRTECGPVSDFVRRIEIEEIPGLIDVVRGRARLVVRNDVKEAARRVWRWLGPAKV
jgi:hypothetical protein